MPTLANDLVLFLMSLFGNQQAAKEFLDNPERALDDAGLGGVCSADVDAAMPVILDFAPINASSFDRSYNTGGNVSATGGGGGGAVAVTPPTASVAVQTLERKGLPILLRAFEALRGHVPARLTIVGATG